MRLFHVTRQIGGFFAEFREVVGEGRFDQGEPGSYGGGVLLQRRRERFAVDEDEDLASITVNRHRFGGFGKIRGDSFESCLESRRERVGVEEVVVVEEEPQSRNKGGEPAGVVEGIGRGRSELCE